MNTTEVAHFTIQYCQFLDADGNETQPLPDLAQDKETMINLYRMMCLARHFDNKALSLQRTGKLGTYAQAIGQEAVTVSIGHAMAKDDIFIPYYRDHGTFFQRNVSMLEILSYWGGDERGASFENNKEDFPPCIPIATQALHAAGVATAIKYKGEKRAVLTTCGDGATSKGDFYEAMNVAGVWYLPCVFVINNNQWAISIPRAHQSHANTLAQKALAAGLPCLQVDGNDVIAMHHAVSMALAKARAGKGPMVIEALSYRLCDHTTADDASRYVNKSEFDKAKTQEPLIRTKAFLKRRHGWTDAEDEALQTACKQEVDAAAAAYLAKDKPMVQDMFDHLFETLPEALQEQRQAAIEYAATKEQKNG